MKKIATQMSEDLHRKVKVFAAQNDTTIHAIITAALEEYIAQKHTKTGQTVDENSRRKKRNL